MFVSGKTGKYLYMSETWKMKGRGENKVIDKVIKKFVWEDEIPANSNRHYYVQFADLKRAMEFAQVWSKKLKVAVHWQRVAMRTITPYFNEVPTTLNKSE
jgi:hypothetical protein